MNEFVRCSRLHTHVHNLNSQLRIERTESQQLSPKALIRYSRVMRRGEKRRGEKRREEEKDEKREKKKEEKEKRREEMR